MAITFSSFIQIRWLLFLKFSKFKIYPTIPNFPIQISIANARTDTFDVRSVGLNDDEFDDDPEDPDYEEEPVDEPEGKSYHPSLIMLNLEFYKY